MHAYINAVTPLSSSTFGSISLSSSRERTLGSSPFFAASWSARLGSVPSADIFYGITITASDLNVDRQPMHKILLDEISYERAP
mmetsp:Transcript_49868/g.149941  ORF Transcript_49868/g.149941 Transcript_49868/m.149941 type:complete len:84 (+) Transcript_49868:626-877(+)